MAPKKVATHIFDLSNASLISFLFRPPPMIASEDNLNLLLGSLCGWVERLPIHLWPGSCLGLPLADCELTVGGGIVMVDLWYGDLTIWFRQWASTLWCFNDGHSSVLVPWNVPVGIVFHSHRWVTPVCATFFTEGIVENSTHLILVYPVVQWQCLHISLSP